MAETNDGFRIAEADMQMRGPGDMEGTQQNVWRNFIFSPKPSPLLYPEPMLLIDDDKTQIRKIYRVFQKGMGSYQQVYFSGEEPF